MPAKRATKRATTKRATKRTTSSRKPKARVTVRKTAKKSIGKVKNTFTKSEIFAKISENTELAKKDVKNVFEELATIIEAHLVKGSAEKFVLPGLLKITVKKVPAKKARKGINPFTGEPTVFKAKPASKKVKITPLKNLKDMVA